MIDSELIADVEPEPSDLSENAAQIAKTQEQARWRAKRAEQTKISKINPLVHKADLAFKDANFPEDWQ